MALSTQRTLLRHSAICILAGAIWFVSGGLASAKQFVWARSSDALTLDPHSINEGATHAVNHQIYEPLVIRDRTGKVEAALAMSWSQSIDSLRWVFVLRPDVTFHDGQPLTAEDVIFSLNRAMSETSDLRTRLQGVRSFKAIAPDQIEITTHVRDPLLPIRLTDIFIMSKAWAEKHDVVAPQNYLSGPETYASRHANGTGPFKLTSREPDKETRFIRNEKYWGWREGDRAMRIQEIIYRPIVSDTDRITSLLDGSVDFVQDVPLAELEVLKQAPGLNLKVGAENRVIFLGLSVVPMLADKPNPLANIALREAVSLAIDRLAIQREIMLGQSIPTGVVAPPGINGFPRELDQIPPRDLVKAKALVNSVAGDGPIALTLDCPTNRYVNDAAICGAIKKQLADIGIQVTLHLQEKGKHIETVRSGQSQFFLLGWGVPTFDSAYIFTNLLHTRGPHLGTWNGTGYSNAELDQLIAQLPQVTGVGARGRAMGTIWQIANDARIYIPLHVQTLIYAMRSSINIDVDISNTPKLKNATLTAPPPPKSK